MTRIALVLPDFQGAGAQRVLLDLARGCLDYGLDVDIVAVQSRGPLRDELPAGARLIDLEASRAVRAVVPLARYFRRERPAAAIACLNHVNLVTIAAARVCRPAIPVMVTHHNHLSTATPRKDSRRARAMPRMLGFGFRFADRIVAVSQGVADDLAETIGLARSRIDVVYNPVDFGRLLAAADAAASHPWLSDEGGPLILGVGRLVEQKDFASLIRAVARLPRTRLLILGDGPLRSELEALVVELALEQRVALPGFVDNPFPYYKAADVFVLSSRWEGLPTALIEALPFATRIVATDCPSGPREILEDGKWGRLVPVGDAVALAEGIAAELVAGPRDRSDACARYEPAAVTRRYLDLLPWVAKDAW